MSGNKIKEIPHWRSVLTSGSQRNKQIFVCMHNQSSVNTWRSERQYLVLQMSPLHSRQCLSSAWKACRCLRSQHLLYTHCRFDLSRAVCSSVWHSIHELFFYVSTLMKDKVYISTISVNVQPDSSRTLSLFFFGSNPNPKKCGMLRLMCSLIINLNDLGCRCFNGPNTWTLTHLNVVICYVTDRNKSW